MSGMQLKQDMEGSVTVDDGWKVTIKEEPADQYMEEHYDETQNEEVMIKVEKDDDGDPLGTHTEEIGDNPLTGNAASGDDKKQECATRHNMPCKMVQASIRSLFICSTCRTGYASERALKVHLKTHTEGKASEQRPVAHPVRTLQTGQTQHGGQVFYQCSSCTMRFPGNDLLMTHMATHLTKNVKEAHDTHYKNSEQIWGKLKCGSSAKILPSGDVWSAKVVRQSSLQKSRNVPTMYGKSSECRKTEIVDTSDVSKPTRVQFEPSEMYVAGFNEGMPVTKTIRMYAYENLKAESVVDKMKNSEDCKPIHVKSECNEMQAIDFDANVPLTQSNPCNNLVNEESVHNGKCASPDRNLLAGASDPLDSKLPIYMSDVKPHVNARLNPKQPKIHTNTKLYKCDSCIKVFSTVDRLERHASHFHTSKDQVRCNICHKPFYTVQYLKMHMNAHESSATSFACKSCPKVFSAYGDLSRHAVVHAGEMPFSCRFCLRPFCSNFSLERHLEECRHHPLSKNSHCK